MAFSDTVPKGKGRGALSHYSQARVESRLPTWPCWRVGVEPQLFLLCLAGWSTVLVSKNFLFARLPLSWSLATESRLLLSASLDIAGLLTYSAISLWHMRQKENPRASPPCRSLGLKLPDKSAFFSLPFRAFLLICLFNRWCPGFLFILTKKNKKSTFAAFFQNKIQILIFLSNNYNLHITLGDRKALFCYSGYKLEACCSNRQ